MSAVETTPTHTARPAAAGDARRWVVPYIAALVAMMMLQISNLGFPPLMPGIAKSWGLSFSQVGLFTGVNGLASMLMAIPAGLLIERFGEKHVLSAGLLVVAFGLGIVAVSTGFPAGMIGRTIWQAGYKVAFVSTIAALSLTIPQHLKASGMGINGALSSLASAVGAPLGGVLAAQYGWQGGMLGYAALALIGLAAFSLLYHPLRKRPARSTAEATTGGAAAPTAFRSPVVWTLSLLMCFGTMVGISLAFFMPTALTYLYHSTSMDAAATMSMGFGIGIPVVFFSGVIADRLANRKLVLAIVMLLNTVLALMMTSASPTMFRASGMLILALGLAVPNLIYAVAGDVLAGRQVGNIMGTIGLGMGVAAYFGPQMLGVLRDVTGSFSAGWYLMAAVSAISFIIISLLKID